MVLRAIFATSLACVVLASSGIALPLAAQEKQPEDANPFDKYDVAWSFQSSDGGSYYSQKRDLDRKGYYNHPTVWVRGDHSKDASVEYRRSLTLLAFDCGGKYGMLAFTSYSPSGSVLDSWDTSLVRWERIRPDTMASSLEIAICD